jgi:hypothetical protein
MKKSILYFAAAIVMAFTIVSFSTFVPYEAGPGTAEVERLHGVYIFTDSKPVQDYEYLGTAGNSIGAMIFSSGQYQPVRNDIVRKLKRKFPEAEGVIFHFNNKGIDKADAIKFK